MKIPTPPTPPSLYLPMPLPDGEDLGSQPPLCTPVDQLIQHTGAMPLSPSRTTVKRRRSMINSLAVESSQPMRAGHTNFATRGVPPHPSGLSPFFGDDEASRLNTFSQRMDLPEMSQDTLALFPRMVREQHTADPSEGPNDSESPAIELAAHLKSAKKRKRNRDSTRRSLAKASLMSALSGAKSMENPFLSGLSPQRIAPPLTTPAADMYQFGIRKVANASESFQSIGNVLEFDESVLPSLPPPLRTVAKAVGNSAASTRTVSPDQQKLNTLKVLLVSSTQGRQFSLEFEQKNLAGRGAFSEVWQAKHRLDGCSYAIKKNIYPMLYDSARLDSLQEVFALSALQGHPNILRYHGAWFEEKGLFLHIQTEYLAEGSLYSRYMDQGRAMPLHELFALASDMSSALAFMHSKGIVHLDVKPDNIFCCNRGLTRDSFIIGDFGLACRRDGSDARRTEGDSRYLCPEALEMITESAMQGIAPPGHKDMHQSDDEADRTPKRDPSDPRHGSDASLPDLSARDVFSLGATLYELAMGIPLEKSGVEWRRIRSNAKRAANEVRDKCGSEEFANLVKRCLEPDPNLRALAKEISQICEAHGNPSNSLYLEKLRRENENAKKQLLRYNSVTAALLQNGEKNRQAYRKKCKRTDVAKTRFACQ